MHLHLLPQPERTRFLGGTAELGAETVVLAGGPGALCDALAKRLRKQLHIKALAADAPAATTGEGYTLSVRPNETLIRGRGPAGLFYGVQTLRQLVQQFGRRLPCLVIEDRPAFPHRGFYLDITRGKVPKLATLKRLADQLAALKVNQLQLYVEHVFDFRFDRDIGRGCDPLTPDDVRDLDRYCRDRFIELVPSLACFGHMGRVLSLPRHRGLAEIPWPARDWKSSTWIQRLRGATLNPRLPASRRLIERMLREFLPLFSSPHFNMCGDETYDLGRGANAKADLAGLYLDHVKFVRGLAEKHGKRLMFWGDMMLHYPRAIRRIPKDCTVLDWGYHPDTRFEKVEQFLHAGLDAYVCPSTRGYRVVFNEVEEARANIAGYARTGLRLGAGGMLTTDWGDMGHFNLLPCSYHGMALGAAMAWNPRADEGVGFDRAFALQFFGDRTGEASRRYVRAGTTGIGMWPFLIAEAPEAAAVPGAVPRARRVHGKATRWAEAFRRMKPAGLAESGDVEQLALACEALRLNAEKLLVEDSARHGALAREIDRFSAAYARAWLASNRPSGLAELKAAFRRASQALRGTAR